MDLDAQDESDVINDGVNVVKILGQMSVAQAKFSLVILDACRDNPFKYANVGGRSIAILRGLAPVSSNARGIMVVYSAGNGQKALDKLGDDDKNPNGLFTREFLKVMETPGFKIQELVDEVRESVIAQAKSVGHTQTPAVYNESNGTFFFLLPSDQKETITTVPNGVSGQTDRESIFWQSAQGDPVACQAYLKQWDNGVYAALARRCIEKGDGHQAETARLAEIEQQRRVAENEKRLAATEEKRKAEEARLAEIERLRREAESRAQIVVSPQSVTRKLFGPGLASGPAGIQQNEYPERYRSITTPSFSCMGSLQPVERLICSDVQLAHADGVMGQIYREYRSSRNSDSAQLIRDEQRAWLKLRNRNCLNNISGDQLACLLRMTNSRIDELWSAYRRLP